MRVTRRRALVAIAVGSAVMGILAGRLALGPRDPSSIDFASAYTGGLIVRHGQASHLYDIALQTRLFRGLIGPGVRWDLPFINPPAGALLVLPTTWLSFDTAYRVWALAQLASLIAGVVIAVRSSPWRPGTPPMVRMATGAVALTATSTAMLLAEGQWDGFLALGLAVSYASWRRGARFTGGAALALTLGVVKPQFGLVLAALLLAWADRRVLLGAVAGVVAAGAASLAVIGLGGMGGFVSEMASVTGRSTVAWFISVSGLATSWLGPTALARAIGWGGTAVAVAGAAVLGRRLRRGAAALEVAFSAAIVLSILGAPHVYVHDLAILTPAFVWCMALVWQPAAAWPGASGGRLLAAWVGLSASAAVDSSVTWTGPPGRMTPWVLIALACAALIGRGSLPPEAPRRRVMTPEAAVDRDDAAVCYPVPSP